MDKDTRNAVERATQKARRLLQDDLAAQLEGHFDVLLSGTIEAKPGKHLSARGRLQREKIVAAIEHKRAAGMKPDEAVTDYIRDAAFTTLNRFVALKMLEARDLVQECISRGEQSGGYKEFCGMAPGLALLPDAAGYRLYVESLFDELSVEIKVLFDRRDAASVLWPRRQTFDDLLAILNAQELSGVWAEDETIGWVYQYFNSGDERRAMRDASQAPRNSRELAVRNQFFTPRYVVQFLTDNTLGRTWYEMRKGDTVLCDRCGYLVRRPSEVFLAEDAKVPPEEPTEGLSQEELLRRTVHVPHRPKKDPRDLKILDPACGSGHFLLYAFDLLLAIYDEAWADPDQPPSEATGRTLAADYPDRQALLREAPILVLQHNLHGVDIDPRCAQISQLALWMRAQRAFRDLSLPRADRPRIRRSNIVLAEPMPGEDDLLRDFTSSLGDPMLAELFAKLVDTMKLAGELGLLLRLEQIVRMPGKGQLELLAPPEERIHSTLLRFLDASGTEQCTRRRLFADDADHGLALLELAGRRFDVVLMNPPFGEPTGAATVAHAVKDDVPRNMYGWFVLRASELLSENGVCGCITDSTLLKQPSYIGLRRVLLLQNPLLVLCDLGWGVLDANVRTCMYVFGQRRTSDVFLIGSALDEEDRSNIVGKAETYVPRSVAATAGLPKLLISYDFGPEESQALRGLPTLDSTADLPWGCGANDSVRLFRLRWEVAPGRVGVDWVPMTNGGQYSPFFRENYLVCRVAYGVRTCAFDVADAQGEKLWDPYARQFIGTPGLTYPKRSELLHVSALPAGSVVTPEGKGLFPRQIELNLANALVNSSFVGLMASYLCGPHKQRGDVALLPIPVVDEISARRAATAARNATLAVLRLFQGSETSAVFCAPHSLLSRSGAEASDSHMHAAREQVLQAIEDIDQSVGAATPHRMERALEEYRAVVRSRVLEAWGDEASDVADLPSYGLGVVFGRFDLRLATGERPTPSDPGPFDPLPARSPGMLPEGDPPFRQGTGILVDDPGHRDDLTAAVTSVLNVVKVEPPADLRRTLAHDFFPFHIQRYSKSRRKAPIYWQLATLSASYSVWLYLHAFSPDTLYKVQNDYVGPKLRHEEQKLDGLRREYGDNPTASQRKELDSQETFVAELRTFLDEVKRVASLWKPDLDDGVVINFAPLWRLVPHHRPWQKECKTTWDALADGDYDWSHLAMHLWPERVVPKCKQDRSLAIAHGLEDVFWSEDADGKWKSRPTPTRPVQDLVKERTSPAVKAALDSLLSAPQPGGASRPRAKGKHPATRGES